MYISQLSKKVLLPAWFAGLFALAPGLVFAQAARDPKIERLFKAKCGSCHGEDGKAQTEQANKIGIRDLTVAAWQKEFSDEQISKAILEGLKRDKGGKQQEMEPFKDKLRADQVQGLVTFIRVLGK